MEFDPARLEPRTIYSLMTGTVVPRPIGWISTLSAEGIANLAPYSYFNAVGTEPPTIMFSGGLRGGEIKDTVQNILDTGEFVFNMVTAELVEAMNATAADAPGNVSEFELTDLTAVPSVRVKPPRVAESPVHFECVLDHIHAVGPNRVVFGRVVHLHVADEALQGDHRVDTAKLKPVGRLNGPYYAYVRELFALERPTQKGREQGVISKE